uniref:Uncharacterized protein n=1 Tax=Arundo donax TaxID=35708 RepID=A0A0A8Z1H8_ARUDO
MGTYFFPFYLAKSVLDAIKFTYIKSEVPLFS